MCCSCLWSGPWGMKNVALTSCASLFVFRHAPPQTHEGSQWKGLLDETHWMVLTKMHYINKQNKLQPTTYNGPGPFFRMLLLRRLWWWWWKRELNSLKNCEAVVVRWKTLSGNEERQRRRKLMIKDFICKVFMLILRVTGWREKTKYSFSPKR